jgi:hypothetical protein
MVQGNNNNDLWPDDLVPQEKLITPLQILKEQGSALSRRTQGIVTGTVDEETEKGNRFLNNFYITSEILNYRYKLLTVRYEITLYPVDIILDEELIKQIQANPSFDTIPNVSINEGFVSADYITAENINGYISVLKLVFGAPKTTKVIKSLYSMV